MPENLSSILGQGMSATDSATATPGKKKLKKVDGHWEDEQGNQFADEAGTQPIKSETAQAKAGAPATNAQSTSSFMGELQDNPNKEGNLFTGQVSDKPMKSVMGGLPQGEDKYPEPKGMSVKDITDANTVLQAYPSLGPSTNRWLEKWNGMTEDEKKKWLARAKNQLQG